MDRWRFWPRHCCKLVPAFYWANPAHTFCTWLQRDVMNYRRSLWVFVSEDRVLIPYSASGLIKPGDTGNEAGILRG